MSKITRCSHPFLLIYINSSISQRKRRHPQPITPHPQNVLPTPFDIPHLTLSLSRPILVHSSIHLHRRPSSVKSKLTPDPSTIPSPPLSTETDATLVSNASITIVNLLTVPSTNNASATEFNGHDRVAIGVGLSKFRETLQVQARTRFPFPTETPLARAHFPSPCYIWQLDVRSRGEFDCHEVYIPVLVPGSAKEGGPIDACPP